MTPPEYMTPPGTAFPEVVFLAGARTGFGSFGGTLKDLSATDLAVIASRAALERSRVPATDVDHVVMGNVLQTSADAAYLARHVGLEAGLPIEVPAVTVKWPWPPVTLAGAGMIEVATGGAGGTLLVWHPSRPAVSISAAKPVFTLAPSNHFPGDVATTIAYVIEIATPAQTASS